ncbi:MAG: nitroreductase family deazaflavin-dependent oxidoreductase [Myxococcota bacterium]
MSKVNVALYRWTGGVVGSTWRVGSAFPWGIPLLLLTTTGRKSGLARTVPLIFIEDGDRIAVVASQGGLPSHPLWFRNIQANPSVEVQIRRRKTKMAARECSSEERARLWPRLVDHYPDYASYETWTDRVIPVVICEPVTS